MEISQNNKYGVHGVFVDGRGPSPHRKNAMKQQGWVEFSDDSSDKESKLGFEEESDGKNLVVGVIENQTSLKWEFRYETWINPNILYQPMPIHSLIVRKVIIPSFFTLFKLL